MRAFIAAAVLSNDPDAAEEIDAEATDEGEAAEDDVA